MYARRVPSDTFIRDTNTVLAIRGPVVPNSRRRERTESQYRILSEFLSGLPTYHIEPLGVLGQSEQYSCTVLDIVPNGNTTVRLGN